MTTTGSNIAVFILVSFSFGLSLCGFLYEKFRLHSTLRNNYFTPHVIVNVIVTSFIIVLVFLGKL